MGERVFCELPTLDERIEASVQAVRWGFHRLVTDPELTDGVWFRMGMDVVYWFERIPGSSDLGIHLAVDPNSHSRWPVRRWVKGVYEQARTLGAEHLHCIPSKHDAKVPNYLMRIGWTEDEYGLVKSLGV